MTKIRVSRMMDIQGLIASMTKAGIEGAEEFGSFLSEFTDQVITGFKNGLSLSDNLKGTELIGVTLRHNTSQKIKNGPGATPKHVLISKATPFDYAPYSFNWQLDSEQQIVVRASFTGAPSSPVSVNLIILY